MSKIGDKEPLYITDDSKVCPHCRSTDIRTSSTLWLDGNPRDLDTCNNCQASFSVPAPGLERFIRQAERETYSKNITITSTPGISTNSAVLTTDTSTVGISNIGEITTELDSDTKIKLDNMNMNIQSTNSSILMLSSSIEDLVTRIDNLVKQNADLQEKILNDPLKGLKNNVFDFNLE